MTADIALPAGFEALEPFVAGWSKARASERVAKRWSSEMAEITSFYEAMVPRVEAALEHLDRFDIDAMPEKESRLFYLVLALPEAANAVEIYGQPTVPYAFPPERYPLTEPN